MFMNEWLNDPYMQSFLNDLISGQITLFTGIFWVLIAAGVSIVGGAIGGVLLASKSLGVQLSAMIGGLFGPTAVIPATAIALVVMKIA
jgi:hypothetical protein